ncbi:hypothetical protein [Comamonas odontotermitis]|nr:hypothetical protein [Comamonas odontotermitis]UBB19520.1 hypothetical protein LAD35_22205 [Comamonas odontotermitis]
MPAPIQLDGPYYPPTKQRLLRAAPWIAMWICVIAISVGAASAIALSLQF